MAKEPVKGSKGSGGKQYDGFTPVPYGDFQFEIYTSDEIVKGFESLKKELEKGNNYSKALAVQVEKQINIINSLQKDRNAVDKKGTPLYTALRVTQEKITERVFERDYAKHISQEHKNFLNELEILSSAREYYNKVRGGMDLERRKGRGRGSEEFTKERLESLVNSIEKLTGSVPDALKIEDVHKIIEAEREHTKNVILRDIEHSARLHKEGLSKIADEASIQSVKDRDELIRTLVGKGNVGNAKETLKDVVEVVKEVIPKSEAGGDDKKEGAKPAQTAWIADFVKSIGVKKFTESGKLSAFPKGTSEEDITSNLTNIFTGQDAGGAKRLGNIFGAPALRDLPRAISVMLDGDSMYRKSLNKLFSLYGRTEDDVKKVTTTTPKKKRTPKPKVEDTPKPVTAPEVKKVEAPQRKKSDRLDRESIVSSQGRYIGKTDEEMEMAIFLRTTDFIKRVMESNSVRNKAGREQLIKALNDAEVELGLYTGGDTWSKDDWGSQFIKEVLKKIRGDPIKGPGGSKDLYKTLTDFEPKSPMYGGGNVGVHGSGKFIQTVLDTIPEILGRKEEVETARVEARKKKEMAEAVKVVTEEVKEAVKEEVKVEKKKDDSDDVEKVEVVKVTAPEVTPVGTDGISELTSTISKLFEDMTVLLETTMTNLVTSMVSSIKPLIPSGIFETPTSDKIPEAGSPRERFSPAYSENAKKLLASASTTPPTAGLSAFRAYLRGIRAEEAEAERRRRRGFVTDARQEILTHTGRRMGTNVTGTALDNFRQMMGGVPDRTDMGMSPGTFQSFLTMMDKEETEPEGFGKKIKDTLEALLNWLKGSGGTGASGEPVSGGGKRRLDAIHGGLGAIKGMKSDPYGSFSYFGAQMGGFIRKKGGGEEGGVMDKIAGGIQGIMGGVGIIVEIIQMIAGSSPLLKAVLQLFQLAFTLFFMPFGNILGEYLLPLAISLIDWVVGFNEWMSDLNWDSIKSYFEGVWNGIVDWFGGLWDGVVGFFRNIFDFYISLPSKILSVVKDAGEWVVNKAITVLNSIVTTLTGLPQKIITGIANIIGGIGGGIKDAVGGVMSTIGGVLGFAGGGYIPPTPGGTLIRVGEGTRGEYIVPKGSQMYSEMGGGGTVINITFSGPVYGMNDFEDKVNSIISKASNRGYYR